MKAVSIRALILLVAGLAAAGSRVDAQEDEVPARATWRPQAPERPEAPPEAKRLKSDFRVERPKAELPSFDRPEPDDAPARPEPPTSEAVADPSESAQQPAQPETEVAAEADAPAAIVEEDEPIRESRVESPAKPAAVDVREADVARSLPVPLPGGVVQPDYPRDALREGQEGYVALEFTVTSDGDVTDVAITEAEPAGVFEDAVRSAIRRWRFEPGTEGGDPVAQRVRHRFVFNLDE